MKDYIRKKYSAIAIVAFTVLCLSLILYIIPDQITFISDKFGMLINILRPFIIGGTIAYLLNFILAFYEKNLNKIKWYEKLSKKGKRGIGLLSTYATAVFVTYLFLMFVLPQLVESLSGLFNSIPGYLDEATKMTTELLNSYAIPEEYTIYLSDQWNNMVNYIVTVIGSILPVIGDVFLTMTTSLWNTFIGLIISVYLLVDKERLLALARKLVYAFLPMAGAKKTLYIARLSNDTFGRFLVGKIIDSAIIGCLTFVILTIFNMPYTLLISVIIGITNIIPFFGPFIGAVPSVILLLFVDPVKALWFILIIFVIQQLDGNFIGPKILGDSIGISAFWILFSILIFSELLGVLGMIIGVPVFAVIYTLIKELTEGKLSNKGLSTNTEDYE